MEQSITHRRSSSRCARFDLLSAATAGSVVTSLVKNKGTLRRKLFWLNKDVNCFIYSAPELLSCFISARLGGRYEGWCLHLYGRNDQNASFLLPWLPPSGLVEYVHHVVRTLLVYLTEVCVSESLAEGFAPFSLALLSVLYQIYNFL